MSDLKSVLSFFIGLIIFVGLVFLAITKVNPKKNVQTKNQVTVTLVPTVTKVIVLNTKKLSLLDRFKLLFNKNKITPTPIIPLNSDLVINDNNLLVKEIKPTVIVYENTNQAGASATNTISKVQINNTVTTIPETGAPTLLLPLSLLILSSGIFLKKRLK